MRLSSLLTRPAAVVAALLALAGCEQKGAQSSDTQQGNAKGEAIWLAVAGPFTGDSSDLG